MELSGTRNPGYLICGEREKRSCWITGALRNIPHRTHFPGRHGVSCFPSARVVYKPNPEW